MDVLIFLAIMLLLLALVGGYISMQHAILKPLVDWLYPPAPHYELQDTSEQAPPSPPAVARESRPIPRPLPDGMFGVRKLLEEQRLRDRAA